MYCSNCGAEINEKDAYCPYCGVMNARAAEREYMEKLEGRRVGQRKPAGYDDCRKKSFENICDCRSHYPGPHFLFHISGDRFHARGR